MSKYSKKAQKFIGHKMHKMKGEDKPQAQKVAIAMSMARQEGMKVPKKKSNPDHNPVDKHEMLEMKEHKRKY